MKKYLFIALAIALCGAVLIVASCSPEPKRVSTQTADAYVATAVYKQDPQHPKVCFAFFGASQMSSDGSTREFVSPTFVPCEYLAEFSQSNTNSSTNVNSNVNKGVK